VLSYITRVVDAFAHLDNDQNLKNVGRRFILPATFKGGTHDMQENLQNSLALSRKYGVTNLFLTMTANPNWQEVLDTLLPGKKPQDIPDCQDWFI
jgi:Helitron helicase-like domain at N-terminus